MRIPELAEARALLEEARTLNPGPWVEHSYHVAGAAQAIAAAHPDLDPAAAHILGLLHDIGRRAGVTGAQHLVDGYRFLADAGYEDAARICLTHSYPYQDPSALYGQPDWSEEDAGFVRRYLDEAVYTDYDRLIQLCDALALPNGYCLMEKRFVDVVLRYGVAEFTVVKWQATIAIKRSFEQAIGCSIYSLLPGVVENTFAP